MSLRAKSISFAVVFSADSTVTLSLLISGIRANSTQPRIAVSIAVPRYSMAIIGVSVSPDLTKTFEPFGMIRHTIGTITTQALKPTCLNVLEIETTFVLSVGFGVSAAAMPCEGTSPIVMAMLHIRYVTKIQMYVAILFSLNGTSINITAVKISKGIIE